MIRFQSSSIVYLYISALIIKCHFYSTLKIAVSRVNQRKRCLSHLMSSPAKVIGLSLEGNFNLKLSYTLQPVSRCQLPGIVCFSNMVANLTAFTFLYLFIY